MSAPEADSAFGLVARRLAALREAVNAIPGDADRRIARDALRDALDRDGEPRLGTQILVNSFAIVDPLHRGSHFEVLLLRQRDLGTHHALKTPISERGSDPLLRRLILDEARHQSRIRHPACLPFGALLRLTDGRPAILTDHVTAPTLSETLRDRRLSEGEAIALGIRLARALEAVHAAGLVHGDVTPGNVFLPQDDTGEAILFDFGLSRPIGLAGTAEDLARACSPDFAAPEARGSRSALEPASDLFSLGRVLSAACDGTYGLAFVRLLDRLMEVEPARRPSGARQVADELTQCGFDATI